MTDAWDRPAGPGGHAAGTRPGSGARVPEQARGQAARRREPGPAGSRAGQGGPPRRTPERNRPGAVAALVLILPPLLAALISGGTGAVFWAGSLLGAIGAAALCSLPGVWWVSTGTPPVVLLMALAGLVVGDASARTSKLGTDLAKVVAGAFPVMGAALLCAVAVGAARTVSARRTKGNGRG